MTEEVMCLRHLYWWVHDQNGDLVVVCKLCGKEKPKLKVDS